MKTRNLIITLLAMLLASAATTAAVEGLNYNFLQATPIGSWQLREDTSTDHKGRQTVMETRSSLLSEETRDGQKYYWIEMSMQTFKVKRDKRKPTGDTIVFKTLVAESAFQDDPANALNNVRAFGEEMILQSGDGDPMLIRGAGGMGDSMLKFMGAKVTYAYEMLGDEDVTVKAGSFAARKIQGSGTTEMKVMFKKLSVASSNTAWISDRVPFGMVKAQGESVTNGKKSTHSSELLAYGESGAVSQITKTPQEMPEMPDIKSIFGGG